MGDVIHCLPALSDAKTQRPEIIFDWVVEESFSAIPEASQYVDVVYKVALRRWRKNLFSLDVWREIFQFRKLIKSKKYDLVIDAQGLIKSGLIAAMAHGPVCGFDRRSARESIASYFYQIKYFVDSDQHAVDRIRLLFSLSLSLASPKDSLNYGLASPRLQNSKRILLVHGSSWKSKEWPLEYWIKLAGLLRNYGWTPCATWGNQEEENRVHKIADRVPDLDLIKKTSLAELIKEMGTVRAAVVVDTGLGHLAAAMDIPVVSIYGATDPDLTGIKSDSFINLHEDGFHCSPCRKRTCEYSHEGGSGKIYPPCYESITPETVWKNLESFGISEL